MLYFNCRPDVLCKYQNSVINSAKFLIGHPTFYASFESKSRLNKIHASINKPRLYVDYAGHFI